jgi:hypothetical protein
MPELSVSDCHTVCPQADKPPQRFVDYLGSIRAFGTVLLLSNPTAADQFTPIPGAFGATQGEVTEIMVENILGEAEDDHTRWPLLQCTAREERGRDRRPMGLDNELAKAIGDVHDAARRLSLSVRSNQAKVSSGRDDTNSKTFFDYKAAARLKEAQNALDRLTTTRALRERGYALEQIKLIQQASLHGSSGGKRAQERAKQAQAQLAMLSQHCAAEDGQRRISEH